MAKVNITRDLICRQIKERGALSFERRYHVTDPFIRRLGLEAELQSPRATTTEPMHVELMLRNKRSHRIEKPAHRYEE
ncbi:hypothetical protein J1605_001033 [Eschrichtius robustus]|uniref:Uncharacterized protein n=1 Tax=Eschrichtius robustus TaxID=9764 RepID=A0AB34GRB0_ESCRO|nr:hypothetical protein J1605_001033 [Eschrichtius robustus]